MKAVAGVAGAAVVLAVVWFAASGGGSPEAVPTDAVPAEAVQPDAEPAEAVQPDADPAEVPQPEAEPAEVGDGGRATIELPDDGEVDAETAADRAELGSATLTIEREWDWGVGEADGAPKWEMGDFLTIWTDHGLVYGSTAETVATFEFFDGETTTSASAPVTYTVVGVFHPVFCEIELTVTETFRVSEQLWENTLLGPLPVAPVPDVVTTFKMTFDAQSLDHFDIVPGSHNSSFSLSDVVVREAEGCSFTG